jgi:hypothetical protein
MVVEAPSDEPLEQPFKENAAAKEPNLEVAIAKTSDQSINGKAPVEDGLIGDAASASG